MTEKDENIKVDPSNHDTGVICSEYASEVPVILQLKKYQTYYRRYRFNLAQKLKLKIHISLSCNLQLASIELGVHNKT